MYADKLIIELKNVVDELSDISDMCKWKNPFTDCQIEIIEIMKCLVDKLEEKEKVSHVTSSCKCAKTAQKGGF